MMQSKEKSTYALWDHSEELLEREVRERMRLGSWRNEEVPDKVWLDQWTSHLMQQIEMISDPPKVEQKKVAQLNK